MTADHLALPRVSLKYLVFSLRYNLVAHELWWGEVSGEIGHSREMLWKHHEDAVAFFTPQITCDTSFKTWAAVTDGNSCYVRGDKYAGQSWWQEDFWGLSQELESCGQGGEAGILWGPLIFLVWAFTPLCALLPWNRVLLRHHQDYLGLCFLLLSCHRGDPTRVMNLRRCRVSPWIMVLQGGCGAEGWLQGMTAFLGRNRCLRRWLETAVAPMLPYDRCDRKKKLWLAEYWISLFY